MQPPIERFKVSTRAKEIMIRIKRNSGLGHWNEICRVALCRSLANPAIPQVPSNILESNIEIDWRTFGGQFQDELGALFLLRARSDGIDISHKESVLESFRAHMERGIASMHAIRSVLDIVSLDLDEQS